jgi:drug/metabolite transporter (DMT)-like permease
MDKVTKTQMSIGLFVIGLICLIIQYLKGLETFLPGISQYFYIFFYVGLILIIIGYYLK